MAGFPQLVIDFLNAHTTLTLATVGPDGQPAAAALFYALLDDRLLFLSEPHTTHVQNLLRAPQVALTIHQDRQPWQMLRGLQAQGEAFPLPEEMWERAWRVYGDRFPFVRAARMADNEAAPLAGPLARVRWYSVRLDWVRLIDNGRRFGWKAEWKREGELWVQVR